MSNQVDQSVALNHFQQPDVNGEQQDTEGSRADKGVVSLDQDRNIKDIHDVLVNSLMNKGTV